MVTHGGKNHTAQSGISIRAPSLWSASYSARSVVFDHINGAVVVFDNNNDGDADDDRLACVVVALSCGAAAVATGGCGGPGTTSVAVAVAARAATNRVRCILCVLRR
ncbi:hypothetical protein PG984_013084 [Apiospora sp. TS-2023a]